jgi:hypothetical protein
MRYAIGLLAIGVSVAACNGAPPAQGGNSLATSQAVDGGATGGDAAARGATMGTGSSSVAAPDAWREVTIPAGTTLRVVLDTAIGSDISHVEQPVRAHLSTPITVNGVTALPQGSVIQGVVTDAVRSGKVQGVAHVAVRFDSVTPRGDDARYRMETSSVGRTAPTTKKKDAVKILAPAAGGALVGRIAGGKKGAAIGTAAGAGAGAAYVMSTRGEEVHLAKGTALSLKLAGPITVKVRS